MEIYFNINNFDITYELLPEIVNDSVNYITARFNFTGSMWDKDTVKTAIFKCNDLAYSVILKDDTCIIPTEALRGISFKVGVCGSFFEDDLQKTVYTKDTEVLTKSSCFAYDFKNGVTPSQYEQIIDLINSSAISAIVDYNTDTETLQVRNMMYKEQTETLMIGG